MFNAVTGIDDCIKCEVCGKLIERKPGGRTAKRVHTQCSKNRPDRKRKARELHQEGLSIKEIAERLGEEPKLVGEWLNERTGNG